MMRTALSGWAKISLLIPLLVGPLANARDDNDIDRLMQLSGLADQVAMVPDQVQTDMVRQLEAMPGTVPESLLGSVERVVNGTLAPDAILAGVADHVAGALDRDTLASLMRWYESDLGRRITAAEVLGSSSQAYEQVMVSLEVLLADTERVAAARAINELYNGTDEAIQVMEITQLAMLSVAMEAGSPDAGYDSEALRNTVRAALDAARPDIERYLLAACVYAYQDLSEAELAAYQAFLARPETRHFNDAVSSALMAEWERAFDIMARRFVGALTAHRAEIGSA